MQYPEPKFKKGQRVRFVNRCQPSQFMIIEAVDVNMFNVLYCIDGKWWCESSLTEYIENQKVNNHGNP